MFDPMEMKKNMINNSIEEVKSGNKKQILSGIEFLGKTIGVGEDFGLNSAAVNVIEVCLSHKNRRIRKAAEEALKFIKAR